MGRSQNAFGQSNRSGPDKAGRYQSPYNNEGNAQAGPAENDSAGNLMLQRNFIKLITVNADYIDEIKEYESVFTDPACFRIYSMLRALRDEDGALDIKKAADSLEPSDAAALGEIIRSLPFPTNSDQMLADFKRKIKTDKLTERYENIIQMLDMLPENEEEQIRSLMDELKSIQSELQNVKIN